MCRGQERVYIIRGERGRERESERERERERKLIYRDKMIMVLHDTTMTGHYYGHRPTC